MDELKGEKVPEKRWYAMRVTFRRELTVKQMLDVEHVESFIPMRRETRMLRGRRMNVMAPVVHNLLFVHAEKEWLQSFKSQVPYLQYMTTKCDGKNVPITVPDRQMTDFMTVASSDSGNLIYFDSNETAIAAGTQVRIHGGAFDGLTGSFVKIKGKRSKKVVVAVQNVLAVAIDAINCDYMEILK